MDGGAVVARRYLYCRMQAAGRGTADEERQIQPLALHFCRHRAHFVEARCDQAGEADDIDLFAARRIDDLGNRSHDAEVDHLVIITLQHHADDVLADVVHVALDSRHQDFPGLGLHSSVIFLFHVGNKNGNSFFHYPRALDHLW